jgi:uncharacterized membrane protein
MEAAMSLVCENQRPVASSNTPAVLVYVLYGLGYFFVVPVLAGLIIAYVKLDECDPVMESHYRFQIRTFWIGLLYISIATPLCLVLIGFPLMIWWFIWSLMRIVIGGLRALEHRPIVNPKSWLFG